MPKCLTKYCKNKTPAGKYCSTCRSRHSRNRNKIRYAYNTLKNNSKRRGKEFELTFEQFTKFCVSTDYIHGKGKKKESFSIDRRINEQGYTLSNIRVVTLSENSKKGAKALDYDYRTKTAFVRDLSHNYTSEQISDLPF